MSSSPLETIFLNRLLEAGLPMPAREHPLLPPPSKFRLDFAYPDLLLAIEIDGSSHLTWPVRARDCIKDARAQLGGWLILRLTAGLVYRDGLELVREAYAYCQERARLGYIDLVSTQALPALIDPSRGPALIDPSRGTVRACELLI